MIAIYVLFNALAADGSGIWSHWPLTTDPWIVVSIYDLLYKASEEKKLTVRNSDIQAINRQAENWYWWKMFGWKLVLVENVWWKMFGRKLFLVEICWCKIFSTEQGNIVLVSLWILNAEFRNMYKPTENTIDNTQTNFKEIFGGHLRFDAQVPQDMPGMLCFRPQVSPHFSPSIFAHSWQ